MSNLLTLHHPEAARRYYIDGAWRRDTLYSLLRDHATERSRSFALRDGSRRLTWAELRRRVDAAAVDLHAAGLRRGQRLAAWLPSRVEAVVLFLACSRNGYVFSPLHSQHTAAAARKVAGLIDAACFIAQPGGPAEGASDEALADGHRLPSVELVYTGDPGGLHPRRPPPVAVTTGSDPPSVQPDEDPDKVVYIGFTSGSTGPPKAVMHSDNTLLANGRALVADWGHDRDEILLCLAPLGHHMGSLAVVQSLVAGMELVTNDPPPRTGLVSWIVQSAATYVMGAPTHAVDVFCEMRRAGRASLGEVRVFNVSGSHVADGAASRFLELGILPQNVYNLAEAGSHAYTRPDDDRRALVATCGRAGRGSEIRLFDPANPDVEAPPGSTGEVGGRGATLMLGYFGDQRATEASFNRQGWFLSGDLARIDESGYLRILGRKWS